MTQSKHPIADLGDDFEPEFMSDYKQRQAQGEFNGMTDEQIRNLYVEEEAFNEHEHAQELLDPKDPEE